MGVARIIEKGIRTRVRKEDRTSFHWQIFHGILRLLLIVCVGVLVWYVTRLDFFTISDVTIEGGETVAYDELRGLVEQELMGSYFLIIPKRFVYLYPKDRIIEVLDKNERVHNVVVDRSTRKTLSVYFEEYVPHALWCREDNKEECFFITEDGYAFTKAPVLHGGAFVRHYIEGVDELHEGVVIERDTLLTIDTFVKSLEQELAFRVGSLLHRENGDIEIYIQGGGKLLVSSHNEYAVTHENLKAILSSSEFSHIQPGNFNYIDLRFGNKAFVNEEMNVATGTAEMSTTTLSE